MFQSIDEKPKNATDLLIDLDRYKEGRMTKTEITKRWTGHSWSNLELRAWALWNWREAGL